ncbi:MAG: acetyl-CoA decarbonylase/synthase complex subunit delta [Dehalococcoidales bacterium]|nr:acetyl-CoA decarbonylase/synthase complex subunit delta [Dehalococcoidales bacterium]
MTFKTPEIEYNGRIREITLGSGDNSVTVGGETAYPFYTFDAPTPHLPVIAMEVYDVKPEDWAEAAISPFKDVIDDPVKWAKKCINEYKAEMICLQLSGTDPNGLDLGAAEAAETSKKMADSIDVPLIVWGTANHEKDTAVLTEVCKACKGKNLIVGPLEEGDYKNIAPTAIACGHTIIASSPIDINLAKQLNILLGNLGVPEDKILIDPTVSSIGYGIEYAYSVIERVRIAALTQSDEKLQYPIICNIAAETWKTKEAKIPTNENPSLGDATKRAVLLEAMSAMTLATAGADVLIMRHPEAIRLVKEMSAALTTGKS